jgi:hypothetical protein
MKFLYPLMGLALLCPSRSRAQVSPIFNSLPLDECASGYLWNIVLPNAFPSSENEAVSSDQSRQWIVDFESARVNEHASLPSLTALENACQNDEIIQPATIETSYERISEEAMQNGSVFQEGDHLSANTYPFETQQACFMYWPNQGYCPTEFDWRLTASLHFHSDSSPSGMQIDFQDGIGWRSFSYDEVIHVHYLDNTNEHEVSLRLIRANGDTTQTRYLIKHLACQSNYAMPIAATPWANESTSSPWEISTTYLGQPVKGNAYYLPSGEFDKPFLFVEGIDFGTYQSAFQCGDFGWCQLTSGIDDPEYEYSMLSLMPAFMDSLRERGYDILLLDFQNGKADMHANAALVEELIRRINATKVGDHGLVVAGASMGGQLTRYAIAHMESMGEAPCIRLWISFDSPHTGAYLPISIQHLLHALNDQAVAREALEQKLLSPAARQLTRWLYSDNMNNTISSDADHLTWYEELESLGFPKNARNIAVTNGSLTGAGQLDQHGYVNDNYDPVVDYNCDLTPCSSGPEAKFLLMPSSGDPWFQDAWGHSSNTSQHVCTQVVRSELSAESMANAFGYLGVFGFLLSTFCAPEKTIDTYYVPANFPNWDYAPGGYRNSISEFIDGINASGALQGASCEAVDENASNTLHCFIPTASALGINTEDPYLHIANHLAQHPEACPFDAFFGPFASNQPHSQLTPENMQFLLTEITGGERSDGTPLLGENLSDNVNFNFGFPGCYEIPSLEVFNGSRLLMNAHQPFQFQNNFDWMPNWGTHFRMTTRRGCSPTFLHVFNQGTIEIGDANGETTGELRMVNGSALLLNDGGRLIVHPGSTLIIEDGSEITATMGSRIEVRGGKIILRPGGRINTSDGSILLIGNEAEIMFEGGYLNVLPETSLLIASENNPVGQLRFRHPDPNTITIGEQGTLHIHGESSEDVAIILEPFSRMGILSYSVGSAFNCSQALIQIDEGAKMELACNSSFTEVQFSAEQSGSGDDHFAQYGFSLQFNNCHLNTTKIFGENTRFHAHECTFLHQSKLYFQEGCYDIRSCLFDQSVLHSNSMQYACILRDCEFEGSANDPFVSDISLNKLMVERCGFYNGNDDAIYKKGGQLSLRCNEFIHVSGITVAAAVANLSSQQQAGYNTFMDVDYCVKLVDASGILLNKGYNDFSGAHQYYFTGTLNQLCNASTNCTIKIPAHRNLWSLDMTSQGASETMGSGPDDNMLNVFASTIPACAGFENTNACAVLFIDNEPSFFNPCPNKLDWSWSGKEKSSETFAADSIHQITLHTPTFEECPLDSALSLSLRTMTAHNENGDDSLAIVYLHEILMSGFDWKQEHIRPAIRWAIDWMQSAFERYSLDHNESNTTFGHVAQCYADVLNHFTIDTLSADLYREQFYHELKKGQFYFTLGRREMAYYLFDVLVDCSLDSLERETALFWRNLSDESHLLSSAPPSDSTALPNFIGSYQRSQYGFGCLIESLELFHLTGCIDDATYRNTLSPFGLHVYPNPCDDQINIDGLRLDDLVDVRIYSAQGRLMESVSKTTNQEGRIVFAIPENWARGVYILTVEDSTGKQHGLFLTR